MPQVQVSGRDEFSTVRGSNISATEAGRMDNTALPSHKPLGGRDKVNGKKLTICRVFHNTLMVFYYCMMHSTLWMLDILGTGYNTRGYYSRTGIVLKTAAVHTTPR